MIEITGNIWNQEYDWLCVTTNGNIKSNGVAVMGKGIALQAAKRYPQLPRLLAQSIKEKGNSVSVLLTLDEKSIVSFPTKHNWWEKSDIDLIIRSSYELMGMSAGKKVVLPRPGCSNGQLDWEKDVKPVISPILSEDRFVVCDLA